MTDINVVFSKQDFEELVRKFVENVPELLLRYPETAELAINLKRQLTRALDTQHPNVVLMGPQGTEKLDLLNAIIDTDLAITYPIQTIGTIARFQYGSEEQCNELLIHLRDSNQPQSLQCSQFQAQLQTLIKTDWPSRVVLLDFFVESEFLKRVNIVDTPATDSTEKHHDVLRKFLKGKHEATTQHGVLGHVVIYVADEVDKESVPKIVREFNEYKQLLGTSRSNSIVVVKSDLDSSNKTEETCQLLREQLGKGTEVLSTSGLLANACRNIDEGIWKILATLGKSKAVQAKLDTPLFLGDLLEGSCDVRSDVNELKKKLASINPYVLKFSLRLAHSQSIDDGTALKQAVLNASNIENLKQRVSNLDLANLLTFARLALNVCEEAASRLEHIAKVEEAHKQRTENLKSILEPVTFTTTLKKSSIKANLQKARSAAEQIASAQESLDDDFEVGSALVSQLQDIYADMRENSVGAFSNLDDVENSRKELEGILGEGEAAYREKQGALEGSTIRPKDS